MYVNAGDVLKRLPISKATLYRWLRNGIIPSIRIGGRVFIEKEALDRLLKMDHREEE